jgi:hypothetical protein
MPETATAALGTAHGMRVRRAEEWAESRLRKREAGRWQNRGRGKGAQLRRQVMKRQKVMDDWRRMQPLQQRSAEDCKKLVGEMRELKWRHQQGMAEAAAAGLEAERKMQFMERRLAKAQAENKVELLQQEVGSLRHSRRLDESAREEVKRAFRAHGGNEMRKLCNSEMVVVLRVLRYELEAAEGRDGHAEEEVTARKVVADSTRCGNLAPKRLGPEPPPPPLRPRLHPQRGPPPPRLHLRRTQRKSWELGCRRGEGRLRSERRQRRLRRR